MENGGGVFLSFPPPIPSFFNPRGGALLDVAEMSVTLGTRWGRYPPDGSKEGEVAEDKEGGCVGLGVEALALHDLTIG